MKKKIILIFLLLSWHQIASSNIPTTDSASITLDTTIPTVTITSPTTSAIYNTTTSTLSLSGSASDAGSGLSGISWASDKGGGGTAAGLTSWSVSGISLYNGSNVITVTASDNAANSSTDTLTVTYSISDTTKPIGSPAINNNAFSTDSVNVTLSLSATDNIGLTGYYVSEN